MSKKVNVVVDLSIFIYANYHIVKKFADKIDKDKFVEKLYSQINNITLKLQKKYAIEEVVLCADSKNFRKDFYPLYKGTRGKIAEDLAELKSYCADKMQDYYDVLKFDKLEADDLLFLYSRKYKPCIIVTNDNDAKLMSSPDTTIYLYRNEEYYEYAEEALKQNKYMKVLFGDDGDNVPRLAPKGTGAKWFTSMYKKFGHLKQSEFYKEVCKDKDIDIRKVLLNVNLTNYSMNIYKKYIPNIEEIIEEI